MTFRPVNSLLAHQPLGSIMRARLQVYRALAAFRQHENGVAPTAQPNIAEVPAWYERRRMAASNVGRS